MRFFSAVPRVLSIHLLAFASAVPAWAGWSVTPVAVRPTTAAIPNVAACNDGAFGTFVAWQEEMAPGVGTLRLQHLLATGDLDPSWPVEGAPVCSRSAGRPALGALPDRSGGSYVWWLEGTSLYVNRVESNGSAAPGWPVDGLGLGTVWSPTFRPSVIEDGSHGLYIAWTTGTTLRAHHLGPDGLGAGGWTNGPRLLVSTDAAASSQLWPDLALTDDGGMFLSWATASPDTDVVESAMRLSRWTAAGMPAPAWPFEGLRLGPFRPEPLGQTPFAPMLAIAADGRGGVFAHIGTLAGPPLFDTRLFRYASDGAIASGWPVNGFPIKSATYYNADLVGIADAGLRVHSDRHDGAIVEYPNPYSDAPAIIGVSHVANNGAVAWPSSVIALGHEVVVRDDGGFHAADFKCCGPANPWDWPALLGLHAEPDGAWSSHFEVHSEPLIPWYGDIALASTGDGGVVYYWSQNNIRYGLFARRFNPTQEVTAVGPTSTRPALSAIRFVPGSGIAARVQLEGGAARLELFDVSGRRLASRSIWGSGTFDVTLPGTASLSSGLYFARLQSSGMSPAAKVVVAR